jgi:calcineurin-like phosphoesterase family protein
MQQIITKWYTSDWHRGHKNLVLSGFRKFSCIEEADETILNNYNEVVKPWDIVYNLGDLTLNMKYDDLAKDISKFNGTKIIIAGNHDSITTLERLKQDRIIGNWHIHKNVKDGEHTFALHHWPLLDYHSAMKPDIHLHGHSHGLCKHGYKNVIDVGVDAWNFKPVNLEMIEALYFNRCD